MPLPKMPNRKNTGNMFANLTIEMVDEGIDNAVRGHLSKPGIPDFLAERQYYRSEIYRLISQRKVEATEFVYKEIESPNGKKRMTARSTIFVRSIMHVLLLLLRKVYWSHLTWNIYNCIPGRGINSKKKRGDPTHQIRRMISRGYSHFLQLDIFHCYENTSPNKVADGLRRYIKDETFIDMIVKVSVCKIGLPIGAPTSPLLLHFVMFPLEYFIDTEIRLPHVIYADDLILFGSKEELHAAYWRIRQFLWYVLEYELKREAHPTPIICGTDILGYVFTPGCTNLRKGTKQRAKKKWSNPRSRASYLGLMKGGNCVNLTRTLNRSIMTETDFFDNEDMQVVRRMNSPLTSLADIGEERPFRIIDYEFRVGSPMQNGKKGKDWYRMQIEGKLLVLSNPNDPNSPKVEKECRRLVKGFDPSICGFFENVEKKMRKVSVLEDKDIGVVRAEVMQMLSGRIYELEHRADGWCFKGTVKIDE